MAFSFRDALLLLPWSPPLFVVAPFQEQNFLRIFLNLNCKPQSAWACATLYDSAFRRRNAADRDYRVQTIH